uniref:UDP-glucuronosyltransferase n=1 Tax=Plutella xylostella TaxID=51655 RepID=A0A2H4WB67_PLUXY|nr:UDP-glucuronosyltransferase [Plutella xylostella]
MWKLLLVLCVCAAPLSAAYKILVVSPVPGKSHTILGDGFVRNLLNAGHEVTYITAFPVENPPARLHQVNVSDNIKYFPVDLVNIKKLIDDKGEQPSLSVFFGIIEQQARNTVSNENVQRLMRDPKQNFDAVIVEWFFSEVFTGFGSVFGCPMILFSSVEPHWMVLQWIDGLPNPAYTVDIQSTGTAPLGFLARAKELFNQVAGLLFKSLYFEAIENKIYEENFRPAAEARGRTLTPLNVQRYNISLMLGNSHVSLGEATRLPQSYKPIGGYHIDPDLKPLSKELKNIIESSKDGVIYFSMGSNLKSKDWPVEIKQDLLKMFSGLKQTVLWKFEEDLPNLPKNVHILKWAPQPTILAHPNTKLFITHGGLLSTTETIHFGVPIIGIPAFADQFVNVDRAVGKGFAKRVDLSYDIAQELKGAIEELLTNPSYTERVKELSLIYHDRPAPPARELVHWVEHVVKTRGAPHLRSPALLVPWYQKVYLDLAVVVFSVLAAIYIGLKRLCCSKKGEKTSAKQKKN